MPGNFLTADTSFAQWDEGKNTEEKLQQMTSYLYMLLEQLRYTLANLGKENINEAEFKSIAETITQPVYVRLEDDEGQISALLLTAEGLTSRITDAEGNLSALTQTVNGMTLSVTNGEASSTIRLSANGVTISSARIRFTGVVTFDDLEESGSTVINGDNITTGTIEGRTFRSILSAAGNVGGEIEMCYLNAGNVAGGIRLDDQGAGTTAESKYRMYLYTESVAGVSFAMKLQSAGGLSVEANTNIYMECGTEFIIDAAEIYLRGEVYYNGEPLDDLLYAEESGTTE